MSLVRAWRQLLVAGWLLLGVEAISQFCGAGVCLASVVLQAWQSQLHESTGGVERRRDVIVHVVVDVIVVIFGLWRQRVHVGWRRLLALHVCTHTHARLTALFPGLPKRQWVAVASAGPYASLYLAPDTITPVPHRPVLYRPEALPAAQPTAPKHWRQYRQWNTSTFPLRQQPCSPCCILWETSDRCTCLLAVIAISVVSLHQPSPCQVVSSLVILWPKSIGSQEHSRLVYEDLDLKVWHQGQGLKTEVDLC